MKRFISVPASQIRIGDFIRWGVLLIGCEVLDVEISGEMLVFEIWHKPPMAIPLKIARSFRREKPVEVFRLAACEAPVCELCGRDPADGYRLCDEHRDSWQKVA